MTSSARTFVKTETVAKGECQMIGVLSVESDAVKFVMLSDNGHELASAKIRLPLIEAASYDKAVARTCAADDDGSRPPEMEPGQVEQDLAKIWDAVNRVIDDVTDEMRRRQKPETFIKSVAVTNEAGTVAAWNAETGEALHNAIHWSDVRMRGSGDAVGGGTGGAIEWLSRHSPAVRRAGGSCRFGTLDAWVLSRLTDDAQCVTDVTNASYTGLFDAAEMDWDRDACRKRDISVTSLPRVMSPDDRVTLRTGRLVGLVVKTVMARPSATLYGQRCYERGSAVVTVDGDRIVALSATDVRPPAPRKRDGRVGPTPVVGFREPDRTGAGGPTVVYGSLAVSQATAVVGWLKRIGLVPSVRDCMTLYVVDRPFGERAYAVPALGGLPFEPYCRPDARMVLCGFESHMDTRHLIVAAVDSVVYSAADVLKCVTTSGGRPLVVYVDGDFSEFNVLLERLADATGAKVCRRLPDMAVHGAARMSMAVTRDAYAEQPVTYSRTPSVTPERRSEIDGRWKKSVRKSYGWIGDEDNDDDDNSLAMVIFGEFLRRICAYACEYVLDCVFYRWFS